MKKLTPSNILSEGMKQIGRAAFTTPSVSRRNSAADSDSKKSMSPSSRRMSSIDQSSVTSNVGQLKYTED